MDSEAVRELLEGYDIDSTVVKDSWIEKRLNNIIVPYVEAITRLSFTSPKQTTEYYSGAGSSVLILNRKPIISVESIFSVGVEAKETTSFELIKDAGMIRKTSGYFQKGNKNIKILYTFGYADPPVDIREVIIYMTAEHLLSFLGSRTGGGDLNINGYSRSFGESGKYTHIRKDLNKYAIGILRKYMTGIVGSV